MKILNNFDTKYYNTNKMNLDNKINLVNKKNTNDK